MFISELVMSSTLSHNFISTHMCKIEAKPFGHICRGSYRIRTHLSYPRICSIFHGTHKYTESISASSPLVGFGELNDNTIKGLISLLSVEQKIEFIAYSVYRFNKKTNLIIFYIMFKSRPKLWIVVLEDHENNIVQEKDNNANGVDEMTSMLRNIIVS